MRHPLASAGLCRWAEDGRVGVAVITRLYLGGWQPDLAESVQTTLQTGRWSALGRIGAGLVHPPSAAQRPEAPSVPSIK